MKNQNILVCGAGSIGKRHIKNLKFLGEQVIVWRSRSNLIKKLEKHLKVKVFLNLDEALKYSKAVVIATSTDNHMNIALKALKLGKPIFIEKPISNNKKNINNLIKLGKKNIIEVGHQLRMHPSIVILKKKLKKLSPKSIMGYRFVMGQDLRQWRKNSNYRKNYSSQSSRGGGAMYDLVHQIDIAVWLFGPVEHVFANLARRSKLKIRADDFTNLILIHKNGVTGQIQLDMVSPAYRGENEIVTKDNVFYFNLVNGKLIRKKKFFSKIISKPPKKFIRNDLFISQMKHFLKRLKNNNLDAACSLFDGILSLNVLLAAEKSHIKKKLIKVEKKF